MRIHKFFEVSLLRTIFTPNQHFTEVNDTLGALNFLDILLGVRNIIYDDKTPQ